MSLTEARQTAAQALQRLDLPAGLTLEALRHIVEDDRGKRIIIEPVKNLGRDQISGLWLSMDDMELILHADTDSPIHSQQIILHELAHMILGHGEQMHDGQFSKSLLPDLDSAMVIKALARCDHRADIEVAAESLADMLAAELATSRRLRHTEPLNFRSVFG